MYYFILHTDQACKAIIDLAFLIDSSGSITRRNWKLMLAFVKDTIDEFDVSPRGSHIASVSYASKALLDFTFNTLSGDNLNKAGLNKLVDVIKHQRGFTFIDKALLLANKKIFTEEGGMRQAVKKVSSSSSKYPLM